jgi:hypothetical protein
MSHRTDMIKRELNEHSKNKSDATYPIDFRGKKQYLPVITVNPDLLLLNPKNNRLSGQLKDHPNRSQVEADPESKESQDLLHSLLAKTDKFRDLEYQLKEMGQKEPGLITLDGLLVNGNTRVAALRELKKGFVDVAVLPGNINEDDVLDMEMSLQVADLVHQDYTFTNQLLLMKRFLDSGKSPDALALKMAWLRQGVKKVNTQMRLLSYIEEVRALSPVPYSVFDTKSEHLKNLDSDYIRLKNQGKIDEAESLKWARLTMTFLRLSKDQVRVVDEDFVEKNLLPRLDDDYKNARNHMEKYRSEDDDDGLDELLGEQSRKTIDMKRFLKDFLADENNRDQDGDGNKDTSGVIAELTFTARRATGSIIDEQILASANAAPSEALKEARVKAKEIRQKLPMIVKDPKFKIEKFQYDLGELIEELQTLQNEVNDISDE